MTEFWESSFQDHQMMWGEEPAHSAVLAAALCRVGRAKDVLIPGIGYGRNATPFLDAGMTVTGIEISPTAISLARSKMGLTIAIHQGSVTDMPFDDRHYDAVYCHALIHLLDDAQRARLIRDCHAQLNPGGHLIFTAISTQSPTYGSGTPLGPNKFEMPGGARLFFYDEAALQDEFGPHGLVEYQLLEDRSNSHGNQLPFYYIVCAKR